MILVPDHWTDDENLADLSLAVREELAVSRRLNAVLVNWETWEKNEAGVPTDHWVSTAGFRPEPQSTHTEYRQPRLFPRQRDRHWSAPILLT